MTKSKSKNAWKDALRPAFGWYFVGAIIAICVICVIFSDDTLDDTNTISGVVTEVKYHRGRGSWLTFKVGDVECYYMIADAGSEKAETVIEKYEQLERSGKTISALTIDDWKTSYIDGIRVVGVAGEKGSCFSLASHNKRQKVTRVGASFLPALMIVTILCYHLSNIKNEIIIPARKRKKRIARKQERKAKFAARQALEQEQSPPQTKQKSKKNKSKKSR